VCARLAVPIPLRAATFTLLLLPAAACAAPGADGGPGSAPAPPRPPRTASRTPPATAPTRTRPLESPAPGSVTVRLHAARDEWILGETCFLRLVVTNAGDALCTVEIGGSSGPGLRLARFEVHARHEDGAEAADAGLPACHDSDPPDYRTLAPGEEVVLELALPAYRRIDRPGAWTVRVRHDLDGSAGPGPGAPRAAWALQSEALLRFREPSEPEARRIANEALSPSPCVHRTEEGLARPGLVPSAVALPRYFPLVAARAREGSERAVEVLGLFQTVEATRALIECLPLFRGRAFGAIARALEERVPVPRDFLHATRFGEPLGLDGCWDPSLAPALRAWALAELEAAEPQRLAFAGDCLAALPSREDAPVLRAALERRLASAPDTAAEVEGDVPDGAYSLHRAWRMAGGRAVVPFEGLTDVLSCLLHLRFPLSEGEFASREDLVPLLESPRAWVRAFAAEVHPPWMAPVSKERVAALLADPAARVREGACRLAGFRGDRTNVARLLELLREDTDARVVPMAFHAACGAGERLAASRILVTRCLDPSRPDRRELHGRPHLVLLAEQWIPELTARGWMRLGGPVTEGEWASLRDAWKALLDGPGAALGEGRFRLDDAAVVPALFTPVVSFPLDDGRCWPPDEDW
jgi:hypothetical protein